MGAQRSSLTSFSSEKKIIILNYYVLCLIMYYVYYVLICSNQVRQGISREVTIPFFLSSQACFPKYLGIFITVELLFYV